MNCALQRFVNRSNLNAIMAGVWNEENFVIKLRIALTVQTNLIAVDLIKVASKCKLLHHIKDKCKYHFISPSLDHTSFTVQLMAIASMHR